MKIMMIPGPRNEELIAKVQAVKPFLRAEDGYDDLLYVLCEEYDCNALLDALYYVCENREEQLKDWEDCMLCELEGGDMDYFVEHMLGLK